MSHVRSQFHKLSLAKRSRLAIFAQNEAIPTPERCPTASGNTEGARVAPKQRSEEFPSSWQHLLAPTAGEESKGAAERMKEAAGMKLKSSKRAGYLFGLQFPPLRCPSSQGLAHPYICVIATHHAHACNVKAGLSGVQVELKAIKGN